MGANILSTFFEATQIASDAFYGDFKFKPYYSVSFHVRALASFFCHILRALYDLACLAYRLIISPFLLISPLSWGKIPEHFMNLADNAIGLLISLVSIAVHPVVLVGRSFTTLILGGYLEDNTYWTGGDLSEEEENWELATSIFCTATVS